METLSRPKKVTGVKSGKIPLVKTKTRDDPFPVANPSDIKHAFDMESYEMAEDEPFYASKEVEKLEDNLVGKQTKKSDIIDRITESRHQRHKNAIEDLHEELGHLNKQIDPQVSGHLESAREQISWIIAEIDTLFAGISVNDILYTYPLKRLETLWDDVVTLLQKRSNEIIDLKEQLSRTECERKDHISELFKHYSALFHDVAYLNADAINVLMDLEVHTSNHLLLVNYRHYANTITQLQLENVVKLRRYRVRWEERLATWRDLHIHNTTHKFISFMKTAAITDCEDIKASCDLMKRELSGLMDRRFAKLRAVVDMKPPHIMTNSVLRWYEEVCELSQTLENTNRKYLSKLSTVGDRVAVDCEEVADKMLAMLKDEGVCSDEEAHSIKVTHFMPLIVEWNKENKEKNAILEQNFSETAALFKSNLHILYDFQNKAAQIWSDYCDKVTSKNNELLNIMKDCRLTHDEINQQLESALDMEMDRMRQDTNDIELKRHLEKATDSLKEIGAAYANFRQDMMAVIKTYPDMISVELACYVDQIKNHVGFDTEQPHVEGEEDVGNKETALKEPHEGADLADNKTEETPTFITEVADPVVKPSYSDKRFKSLEDELSAIYLSHLDVLQDEVAEDSKQTVAEKLCELKSEVELRYHIHKPRAMRMKLDIYNVRLNELKNHEERVKQHAAGVTLEISSLRNEFKELGIKHEKKEKLFKELVESCEKSLPSLEKTAHLSTLQAKVNTANEEHLDLIKLELSNFRGKMEDKLNDLRESNQRFGLAFKPFAEGGNFGPDEIETYRKRLEKCNLKIDNCETFILTELDGMEAKSLETADEITTNFDNKLKMHILDVAFLEKVNSWMSNCQVKIKTEVAACNMMSRNLKSKIEVMRRLIDSCARPHPDKPIVKPEEVVSAIPEVYSQFQKRIHYLDCAKPSPQVGITINPSKRTDIRPDSPQDFHSVLSLTKNILNLSKNQRGATVETESVIQDKKKGAQMEMLYDWFILKEKEKEKPPAKRGKSRVDTSERTKRNNSASSRSSMMSVVLTDCHSFMPLIKKILQETQGALCVSSEAYYAQYQGPPMRAGIADTLEGCMEGLNKRLNNYYLQTEEFYNKCIQELRGMLTEVMLLHREIPKLLFNEILENYVTLVSQKTYMIKHQFDRNKTKVYSAKETNKQTLKPILGHPNNEVDLNNLCRKEEDRMLESSDILNEFVNEMTNTESTSAKEFVVSINDITEKLLNLFDQLITTDDVILGKVAEQKLPATVLLKREVRAQRDGYVTEPGQSSEGREVKLLNLADITERTSSSRSNSFKTSKFTPVHEDTLRCKTEVCEEYKTRFSNVMEEVNIISSQWIGNEEKWKQQWASSVDEVRKLYKPSSLS